MINILTNHSAELFSGLGQTLLCSLIALFFSLVIGSLFAIMEVLPSRLARTIGRIYVEVVRNIPLLVVTMFFYIVIPRYVPAVNGFTAGTIGLTIYTSAFIAETVRAGIQSVSGGQMEAARSNGMTFSQAMRYIILPQAQVRMIPALVSQFISLIKDTSLATIIMLPEMMYHAQIIYGQNTNYIIPMFVALAGMYFVVCYTLSIISRKLEKKLA